MTTMRASEARIPPDTFNRVAYQGERVRVERRGAPPVAIVSIRDLELLEFLEDQIDIEAAAKALADMKGKGEKPVPWEEAKRLIADAGNENSDYINFYRPCSTVKYSLKLGFTAAGAHEAENQNQSSLAQVEYVHPNGSGATDRKKHFPQCSIERGSPFQVAPLLPREADVQGAYVDP